MDSSLQTYDPAEDRQKACWFPFKNAYNRRRIKPEHEFTQKIYVFDDGDDPMSKAVELSLTDYAETSSEELSSETPVPTFRVDPLPSDLLTLPRELDEATTHNSILGEEDDLFVVHGQTSRLAAINPNCMSREFWVDEMVEGGSLACAEDLVHAGRSVTRIGRSFNSLGSASSNLERSASSNLERSASSNLERSASSDLERSASSNLERSASSDLERSASSNLESSPPRDGLSDDVSFSRNPTPTTKARIEVEYDFSKKNISFNSANEMNAIQRGTCGAIRGQGKPFGDANARTRTEISSISNSTATGITGITSKGPRTSHTSASASASASASISYSSGSTQSSIMKPPYEVVHPAPMEPVAKRFFCGAMQPMPPMVNKKPQNLEVIEEEKKTDNPTPTASVKSVERSEGSSSRSKEGNSQVLKSLPKQENVSGLACTRNPSLDAVWASTTQKGCAVPNSRRLLLKPVDLDDPLAPHFFVEVEATERQLQEVRDLNELQRQELLLQAHASNDVNMARTASLMDDDSAFRERECIADVFKKFAPKRPSSGKRRMAARIPPQEVRESATVISPPRGKTRVTVTTMSPTEYRPASATPDRISLPYCTTDTSHVLSSDKPKLTKRLPSRIPSRESSRMDNLDPDGFKYAQHPRSIPQDPLPDVRASYQEPGTQSLKRTTSRNSNSRRQVEPVEESPDVPSRVHFSADRQRSTKSHGLDSASSSSRGTPEVKPDGRRSHSEATDLGPKLTKLAEDLDYSDMETEIGQASEEDVAPDFELAKFPSLTEEDWHNTAVEHVNVTRLSSRIVSKDRSTAWNRRGADYDFDSNVGSEMMRVGSSAYQEAWRVSSPQSLDESFEKAVPFVGEHSGIKEQYDHRGVDHRGRSAGTGLSRSQSGNSGEENDWFDEDELSDLNTEAFHRLAVDTDDDSIFNGLVDRTPSARGERRRERDGPPTSAEAVDEDDDSAVSENSVEQSKYTSYTAADQSKYSKYSRGDMSKYSRRSTRTDMVSRGERTAAFTEAVRDPFTCMDDWIDT